jgi:predicted permease
VDLPLSGSNTSTYFTIEGRAEIAREDRPLTECRVVTPHYFEAMEIPLLAGRDFAQTDTKQTPNVAVINQAFARSHFAEENPIGHRINLQGQRRDPPLIVGVVGDVRDFGLDEVPTPEVYFPFLQNPLSDTYDRSLTIVARTKSEIGAIAGALRDEMLTLDKSLPVYAIRPMTEYLSDSLSRRRFNMTLLSVFAAVALLLAAVGIYGVMSYSVAQQTHAIGISMALGAETRHILRQVIGQAMRLTLTGISVGLLAAFALTRLMASLLYDISPTDPLTFALIALALAGVALAASYIPARRAMKVDPIIALRYE